MSKRKRPALPQASYFIFNLSVCWPNSCMTRREQPTPRHSTTIKSGQCQNTELYFSSSYWTGFKSWLLEFQKNTKPCLTDPELQIKHFDSIVAQAVTSNLLESSSKPTGVIFSIMQPIHTELIHNDYSYSVYYRKWDDTVLKRNHVKNESKQMGFHCVLHTH